MGDHQKERTMAPQAAIRAGTTEAEQTAQQADAFATALTALSAEYGIGIAGTPVLFMMEHEDYAHSYHVNDASELILE